MCERKSDRERRSRFGTESCEGMPHRLTAESGVVSLLSYSLFLMALAVEDLAAHRLTAESGVESGVVSLLSYSLFLMALAAEDLAAEALAEEPLLLVPLDSRVPVRAAAIFADLPTALLEINRGLDNARKRQNGLRRCHSIHSIAMHSLLESPPG